MVITRIFIRPGGFTNGNNTDDDYAYDNNGNLIVDKNKSIQSITYNHLNLPVKVTKTSGDYVLYTYDATGRKLIQDVYDPANILKKRSDYRGEWFLENDTLKFINHEEGRAVVEGEWAQSPQLMPNSELLTTTGYTTLSSATLTNETISGSTYMKVTSNQTTGQPGFTSGEVNVTPGNQYMLRFEGYRVGAPSIFVSIYGVGTQTTLLSNTPGPALGPANERWFEVVFTVPTYANRIKVQMNWYGEVQTGNAMYFDNIQLYEYHPGHGAQVFTQSGYTYQYHLKDHLGNVRMTFTTKDESESSTATFEAGGDNEAFLNYDKARLVYSSLFDHTNGNSPGYSQRLSGSYTEKIGLAKSFAVMPGDTIKAEVFAKYFDPDASNLDAALQTLVASLLNPVGSGGQVIDGTGYSIAASTNVPWAWGNGSQPNSAVPKAYLNYIYINKDFDVNSIDVHYDRISLAGLEDGTNVPHDTLKLKRVIEEPGYVYVFLSNDGEEVKEVYFDDFKVEHVKSPVISSQDYYPFGLVFGNYQRENSLNNQYKFQGQEHQDELDLGWDSFKWRNHQPEIGRFFNIDPLAEKYVYNSPYAFSENQVVASRELEGLEKVVVTTAEFIANERGKPINTGNEVQRDNNVYNRNFGEAPNGGDYKRVTSEVETSNGAVLYKDRLERGDAFEEFFQSITGDMDYFSESMSGEDTKSGSRLTGSIEDANFTIDISVDNDVMTFTTQMSGGDENKAYSIKMGEGGLLGAYSFVIGGLKSGREKGTTNSSSVSIKFTTDKNGNAVFSGMPDLIDSDKNKSTQHENR